jgi:hypothetical protein
LDVSALVRRTRKSSKGNAGKLLSMRVALYSLEKK